MPIIETIIRDPQPVQEFWTPERIEFGTQIGYWMMLIGLVGLIARFLYFRWKDSRYFSDKMKSANMVAYPIPVFAMSPWDNTVEERAQAIEQDLEDSGNPHGVAVVRYYYNGIVAGKSTYGYDFPTYLEMSMTDYIKKYRERHEKAAKKKPNEAAEAFSNQYVPRWNASES